ncbi:MAG: hypothetical protein GX853_03380 [Chloroflexi bacterium]|nr:hypothetical protein [Chloroflexota bacterium]
MKDLSRKVLNLFIVLALLLVLVPQQHSTATPMRSEDRPEEVKDPETYFTEMVAGPEKEALGETQMARSRVLTVAGWHFKAYWDQCDFFDGENFGTIAPRTTLDWTCYISAPLILPSGSKITRVDLNYYDRSDKNLRLTINRFVYNGSGNAGDPIVTLDSSGNSGYGYKANYNVSHVIEEFTSYQFIVTFPVGADTTLQFSSVNVTYEEPGIFGNGFPVIMQKP